MSGASYEGGDPSTGTISESPLPAESPVKVQRATVHGKTGWLFIVSGSDPVFTEDRFADRIARRILFT